MGSRDRLVVRKGTADRPRSTEVWAAGPFSFFFLVVARQCAWAGVQTRNFDFLAIRVARVPSTVWVGLRPRPRPTCTSPPRLIRLPIARLHAAPEASFLLWLLLLHPSLPGCSTAALQHCSSKTERRATQSPPPLQPATPPPTLPYLVANHVAGPFPFLTCPSSAPHITPRHPLPPASKITPPIVTQHAFPALPLPQTRL